ncbi:hypothetical protein TSUD_219950 [Trifolium subterraneum]|uniref:Uncharacterized protein n=1 Tax=Trifolium subterraneum TaxID=3900 RepID=A0A2Z6NTV5_TRISU|nr:hypothetical protein TSUD_219950 [Trifolium subterraneum]
MGSSQMVTQLSKQLSDEDWTWNNLNILLWAIRLNIPKGLISGALHQCGEGHEPFVSYEGLEQLHRFLFVLGMTHVLYSFLAVGLAMSKMGKSGYHGCYRRKFASYVFCAGLGVPYKNQITLRSVLVSSLNIDCRYHMIFINIWFEAWKMNFMAF